ncbi:MAG: SurA N-terminal domain-containing protein [Pseudomonadota bacterium]
MQAFRDVVRGWLGKVMLGLLALPLVLVGVESYFGGNSEVIVAEVDGHEISQSLLDKAFENQKQQLLARSGADTTLTDAQQKQLRERVLNSLIQRQLLLTSAQDAGYKVSDATIQTLIQSTPTFQEAGKFSPARYAQVLSQIGETPVTFPDRAREEILTSQRVSGLLMSAFVTPAELDQLSSLDSQQRDISYALVPASGFMAQAQVSDAQVKIFYDQEQQRFSRPEVVSVNYLSLSRGAFSAQVKLDPALVKARYDERVKALSSAEERQAAHILITVDDKIKDAEAKAKIDALAKQVVDGADFAALAKANSKDPGSAANGGDLGLTARGQLVPEFDKALFGLAKVGDVSTVVKSPFGYHLIKLLAIKQPSIPSFAQLQGELEQEVRASQADELFTQAVEKLDAAVYESADLQGPAKSFNLSVQTSPVFDRQGADGLWRERKILDAAFSDDLIKERKNTSALTLKDGTTVWLSLARHEPSRKLPLAEVAPAIRAKLQFDQALALAVKAADAIAKTSADAGLANAASSAGLTVQTRAALTRRDTALNPALVREAFRVAPPTAGKVQTVVVKLGDAAAVLAVSAVKAGPVLAGSQRAATQTMLGENRGQQELQDVLGYLKAEAKVTLKTSKSAE